MLTRRSLLQAAAGLAALSATAPSNAALADWKEQVKELTIATIPDENSTGVEKRYDPFIQYLEAARRSGEAAHRQ